MLRQNLRSTAISSMARRLRACSSRATCWWRRPRTGRAMPATSSASPTRRPPATSARRSKTCRSPTTRAWRPSRSAWPKPPTSTRPQEAQIFIRMAEAGGRAVERKLVLPVAPVSAMIGVKPLFGDKNVAEGDKANFDVVFVAPDGKPLARDGLRYELLKMELHYQWYRQNSSWDYEPVKTTTRVADGDLAICSRQAGARHAVAAAGPLPARRQVERGRRAADVSAVRRRLVFRRQRRHAGSAGNLDRPARTTSPATP